MVRLDLLGGFSARLETGHPCVLPTRKAQGLLAYLALPLGQRHSRDKLTALLWGDTAEAQARQSFRQTLTRLRRALGEAALITEGDAVALDDRAVTVDVADFEAGLADGGLATLERAVALYKGDLLDGFSLDEGPFEEWRLVERERLHERALEGLARLLRERLRKEQTEEALQTALRILALDPLQEPVHRTLMRLLSRQGRRAAALQQYQVCVGWLQRELGTEPEEATRTLYRELLRAAPASREGTRASARGIATVRDARGRGQMIGRARELAALRQTVDRALDNGGRAVVITGEAGIGKSRLIEEFGADVSARGIRVLTAWCHETEQPLPFRPWLDALRGNGTALPSDLRDRLSATARGPLARLFPELGLPGEPPLTAADEHPLLFEALSELVHQLSQEAPLLVVLEDLHWADAMSARLLAFLGRRVSAWPVLIVGTVRSEEVESPVLQRALDELRGIGQLDEVSLGPLSRDESVALARALRSGERRKAAVDAIADDLWVLSEGNPFVIVETVRALDEEAGRPSIPRSVRQSVSARLARLSGPARQVATTAAVIGRACSFKLLAQGAGCGELEAATAVEELVRRRVLEAVGDRVALSHERVRQVAYDELLSARRIAAHGAVARALEALHSHDLDEVANELGHHFLISGDVARAIDYLERFADVAARRYALDAAIDTLRQASDAVEQLPETTRDRRRLEVMLRQTFVMSLAGRHRESLEVLRQHAVLHEHIEDPALASDYHFRVATTCHHFGQYVEGKIAAEAAVREGERAGDGPRVGKGLYALSIMSIATGALSDAVRQASRAAALLDAPRTRHWLGLAHWSLTWAHTTHGALDTALESAERCADIARAPDDRRLQAFASYTKALIYAAYGDARAAADCARGAKDAAVADPVARSLTLLALAYAHLEAGEARQAIEVFHQILERGPASITQSRVLALLGDAHLAAGELDAGTEAAREALRRAVADGSPFVVGLAERALGRLARASGDRTRGAEHLSRALESFNSCDAQFEAAMTRLDLVHDAAERGEHGQARTHAVEAIRVFDKVGASRRVAQANEVARALGLDRSEP